MKISQKQCILGVSKSYHCYLRVILHLETSNRSHLTLCTSITRGRQKVHLLFILLSSSVGLAPRFSRRFYSAQFHGIYISAFVLTTYIVPRVISGLARPLLNERRHFQLFVRMHKRMSLGATGCKRRTPVWLGGHFCTRP